MGISSFIREITFQIDQVQRLPNLDSRKQTLTTSPFSTFLITDENRLVAPSHLSQYLPALD